MSLYGERVRGWQLRGSSPRPHCPAHHALSRPPFFLPLPRADAADTKAPTESIRAVNKHVFADDRVDVCMLPVSDGVTIARKR